MNRRSLVGAVLALLAVVLAVVFALTPANFHRADITWSPTSVGDSGALQLMRGAPESMTIETSCDLARSRTTEAPSMLTTGTLELFVLDGEVGFRATPDGRTATLDVPSGDCEILGSYDLDSSTLSLSVGDEDVEITVDPPTIYGLYTTDPPSVSRVDLTTQDTALAPSWGRWLIGLTGLVALVVSIVLLLLTTPRQTWERRGWRRFVPRLAPIDGFVTAGLLALALVTPALIDDGWVMGRTSTLFSRGRFGNLYDTQDAWLPQGLPHEVGLALLQSAGLNFPQLRFVVALLVALTWIVLRRGVLVPALGERASRWPAAAATYLAFAGAWLITVRAEPIVLFLGVVALTVAISAERCAQPRLVMLGLTSAALALGAHQSGWIAVGPAAVILLSAAGAVRRERQAVIGMVTAILGAGSAVILVTFAAADVGTAIEGAKAFANGAHSAGPLDELDRYGRVLAASGARFFTVLLLLIWCLAGSLGINGAPQEARRLWVLTFVWLGGLLFTSSKWEWHLAVYAAPAAALAALAGVELSRRDRTPALGTGAVMAMVVIAAGVGLRVSGVWTPGDLGASTWPELTEKLLGDPSRKWWYLALVVLVILGLVADRRPRWRPAAVAALCLSILFPLSASMAWLVADAVEPGWSPTGGTLRQLMGDETCGLLEGLDVDADVTPLNAKSQPRGTPLAPEAFPHVERIVTGPLGGDVPTWGTWAPTDGLSADARTGTFLTAHFELGDAEEITIWSAFGSANLLSADVVFFDASGQRTSTAAITPNADLHWARLHVDVPDGATGVRIEVSDENGDYGGWLAVSSPVVQSRVPISSVLRASTGFASPFDATLYPCLQLPDLRHGYWERVDYVSSEGLVFNTGSLRGLTVTDIACRPDVACLRQLEYEMADVEVVEIG